MKDWKKDLSGVQDFVDRIILPINKSEKYLIETKVKTRIIELHNILKKNFDKIEHFIDEEIENNNNDKNLLRKLAISKNQQFLFLLYILQNELKIDESILEKNFQKYKRFLLGNDSKIKKK